MFLARFVGFGRRWRRRAGRFRIDDLFRVMVGFGGGAGDSDGRGRPAPRLRGGPGLQHLFQHSGEIGDGEIDAVEVGLDGVGAAEVPAADDGSAASGVGLGREIAVSSDGNGHFFGRKTVRVFGVGVLEI